MIWKMAPACDVHEVMTYEVRVQAQRSAIQPRKQQCELRFWDTPPTEMFLIPFFSLPWISLSCLIHPQFSMKNQPSLGPLHSPYFSIITCPRKHIEKQNPAGVWRMKGAERPPSGRGGKPEILIIVSIPTGKVKVTRSCPTLCHPMDYTVHGILQARILEWVAFPSSRDLPNPGIEPRSTLQADSLPAEPQEKPKYLLYCVLMHQTIPQHGVFCIYYCCCYLLGGCLTLRTLFHIPVLPFLLWTIKTIKFISEGLGQVYMG